MHLRPVDENIVDVSVIEALTHNRSLTNQASIDIRGWLVSKDDHIEITASIWSNDEKVAELGKKESADVFEFFQNTGITLQNAKNSRFDQRFLIADDTNDIFLRVYLDGNMVEEVQLTEEYQGTATEQYEIYIDSCSIQGITDAFSEMAEPKVKIVESINKIYRAVAAPLNALGLLCYAVLSIFLVLKVKKEKWYQTRLLSYWLICTGILASVCVNIGGVAYTSLSAFYAVNIYYLSSAICMLWVFTILSIGFFAAYLAETYYLKQERNQYERNS